MTNREQRTIIAQETMNILKQGFYQNQQGEVVNIQDPCLAAKTGSIHYSAEMWDEVFAERDRIYASKNILPKITFEVRNETTLSAANRLVNEEGIERVLCLNFASAKNLGVDF